MHIIYTVLYCITQSSLFILQNEHNYFLRYKSCLWLPGNTIVLSVNDLEVTFIPLRFCPGRSRRRGTPAWVQTGITRPKGCSSDDCKSAEGSLLDNVLAIYLSRSLSNSILQTICQIFIDPLQKKNHKPTVP